MKPILFLIAMVSLAAADPIKLETLTTTEGKIYKGVTVTKILPDEISITHETGLARIPFEKLPPEIQSQLGGFDSEKAEAERAKRSRDLAIMAKAEVIEDARKELSRSATNCSIGKTPAECIQKYGKPMIDGNSYAFTKADIWIDITFSEGKAVEILYQKPKDSIGQSNDFTDDEFTAIAEANRSGGEWKMTAKHLTYNLYESGDKTLVIYYDKTEHTATVSTVEYAKKLADARKAKLDGL